MKKEIEQVMKPLKIGGLLIGETTALSLFEWLGIVLVPIVFQMEEGEPLVGS